ncbi:hypothetical protein I553_9647 [Mycobacterium xenopi 4042]|uniref:Uncharacterized protein n=1 Tax=Mycobacterium xenopi 4042 TaxID=1299334 RepID=X8E0Y0_MYCXE|nr:hypothetical protein I553_9647 [Mycobacterium xenopi 4042]
MVDVSALLRLAAAANSHQDGILRHTGGRRTDVHIRSGAVTPRMPKPLAITCRVA